jgi:hypothetical protein
VGIVPQLWNRVNGGLLCSSLFNVYLSLSKVEPLPTLSSCTLAYSAERDDEAVAPNNGLFSVYRKTSRCRASDTISLSQSTLVNPWPSTPQRQPSEFDPR